MNQTVSEARRCVGEKKKKERKFYFSEKTM